MNLKSELDKLAKSLVDGANDKDANFAEKLDTFKELRAYYALTLKEKSPEDDADGGFDFNGGVGHEDGAVRDRRSS